jgi:hypothetical protein
MSTVSKRQKYSMDPVRSVSTDTGHLARTPIATPFPFFVGFAGTPAIFSVANVNLGEFLHWGSLGFLALPVAGILAGLMMTNWEVQAGKGLVKSIFSPEDKELLRRAKKNIGLRRRLEMLFYSSAPTVLLVETDKYKMTHTKVELMRQRLGDGYAIEIETTSALKTWDLALAAIVPESLSKSIEDAAFTREAKRLADEIRKNDDMLEFLTYESEEYYKELDRHYADDNTYEFEHSLGSKSPEVVSRSKNLDRFDAEEYEYDDL